MDQAGSVLSTPRTDSSLHRPMFPPPAADSAKPAEGLSRRHMLAGLAAVGIPTSARLAATERDPIYDAIEKHRDACKVRSAAVRAECDYETEHGVKSHMTPEQRRIYGELEEATEASWYHLDDVSADLLNTKPTTFAGVIALCEYLTALLDDPHLTDLPESIAREDDTESTTAGAFANVILKSLRDIAERGAR